MNIALWVVQILLALLFTLAGVLKTTQPIGQLATRMRWVPDFAPWQILLIGTLELLGAAGLIIPALTGRFAVLTPLAAAGLALTMVGAIIVHLRRNEVPNIVGNVVILLLACVVAYGRLALAPL
jgi:uncharacterized membrane protein YphA (DoxX/SURF4 family)